MNGELDITNVLSKLLGHKYAFAAKNRAFCTAKQAKTVSFELRLALCVPNNRCQEESHHAKVE